MKEARPAPETQRGWKALPRALRYIIVAVGSVLPGWVVVINILLATGAIEALVSRKYPLAELDLELGRAWMLRPDTIHVRDLKLSVDAPSIRLHIELGEGTVRLAFVDLLTRSFHTRSIVGEHAAVTLQRKMPHDDVDERRLARFSAIPAFDTPPVLDPELPEFPPLDEAWTIELEGVDVRFDRFVLDEVYLEPGTGWVEGNVRFVIGHALRAWGVAFRCSDARVAVFEEDPLVHELDLRGVVQVHEYNPDPREAHVVISEISGAVEGRGEVGDLSSLATLVPAALSTSALGGGAGPIELELALVSGLLEPGSHAAYESEAIRLYRGDLVLGTGMQLEGEVDGEGEDGVSRLRVELRGVHGGLAGARSSDDGIVASSVDAFVGFAQSDLASKDWPVVDAGLAIPDLHVADLGVFAGAIDSLESASGSLDLTWRTRRIEDGRYGHDATIEAKGAVVKMRDLWIGASTEVMIGARTTQAWTQTTVGKLRVWVDELSIESKKGRSAGTWLRVNTGGVEIHHGSRRVDARLRGRLEDLRPVLIHTRDGPAVASSAPDLDLTQPLDFDLGIHATRRGLTLDIDELSRPALNLRGKLRKVGEDLRYAFQLLHARIGIHGEGGGKPEVKLAVPEGWLEERAAWVESLGAR